MALEIIRVVNEPVSSNCFLLFDREVNNDCLVVDPGCEIPDVLRVTFMSKVYRVDTRAF